MELWLSIHCWLHTWSPAPSARKETWGMGEKEASMNKHFLYFRFNVKAEKQEVSELSFRKENYSLSHIYVGALEHRRAGKL